MGSPGGVGLQRRGRAAGPEAAAGSDADVDLSEDVRPNLYPAKG